MDGYQIQLSKLDSTIPPNLDPTGFHILTVKYKGTDLVVIISWASGQ